MTMARAEERRRFRIAFANLNDDPATPVEGLGFTGAEVRRSFELAARTLPVDMIYYDNASNPEAAVANAEDAVGHKVDLLIEYNSDLDGNAEIGRKLRAAGIPVLAVNYPVPGAPFYGADKLPPAASPARRLANSPGRTGRTKALSLSSPATSVTRRPI
jgi:hypothetical protein